MTRIELVTSSLADVLCQLCNKKGTNLSAHSQITMELVTRIELVTSSLADVLCQLYNKKRNEPFGSFPNNYGACDQDRTGDLVLTKDALCLTELHKQKWKWLRGRDLNPRPPGYEPDELPDCSTPR